MKIIIPLAQTLATDDLGWCKSNDEHTTGGPHRLHSNHKITKEDYIKYVNIAKSLGTRFMTGFVLSEFDRENTCGKPCYNKPCALIDITEKGLNWKNTPEDPSVMDFVKENGAYIDFGLHGVRHGHYVNGENLPGEWARRPRTDENDNPLPGEPSETVPWDEKNETDKTVANCYKEILRQYFTEEELDFPESFIPPSHILYVNPKSNYSTLSVLSDFGVKYSTLRYTSRHEIMPHFTKFGLFDHNVFMVDRRAPKEVSFDKDSCKPVFLPRFYPFIETHFNNLWGAEEYWTKYLSLINLFPARMLAKNTENVFSQWVYRKFVKIKKGYIDFSNVPQEFYDKKIVSNLVLKIFTGPFHIKSVVSDLSLCGYYKDKFGFAYLTLADNNEFMGAPKGKYKFSFKIGVKPIDFAADNSFDTYALYGSQKRENDLIIKLKVYRNQNLNVRFGKPVKSVISSNPSVEVVTYDKTGDFLNIVLKGTSMKGNITEIKIMSLC